VSQILAAAMGKPEPRLRARVAARMQRATLSAVMTLLVALVDRRLRKALHRSR